MGGAGEREDCVERGEGRGERGRRRRGGGGARVFFGLANIGSR